MSLFATHLRLARPQPRRRHHDLRPAAPDDEGDDGGSATIRAAITVDLDGQRPTADYTIELGGTDEMPAGEIDPGSMIGPRLTVEPPGTPAAPLSTLFAEEDATPAPGTPIS